MSDSSLTTNTGIENGANSQSLPQEFIEAMNALVESYLDLRHPPANGGLAKLAMKYRLPVKVVLDAYQTAILEHLAFRAAKAGMAVSTVKPSW